MNYLELISKINDYKQKYNVIKIGKSCFERDIFAVEKINGLNFPAAIFLCSVHARENITTDLVCKMLDENIFSEIKDFNLSFILMANPDGVELSNFGLSSVPKNHRNKLYEINDFSEDFSLWKANGRGVDLNNNFDANFGTNVHSTVPSSSGYIGKFAESEFETKAIANYTRSLNLFFTISYHSKGEEIYYNFFQQGQRLERDKRIAERFSNSTRYVIKNPEQTSSGGYKDFCVQKLKIPALTIEVGSDSLAHPIKREALNEIFDKNKNVANDLNFAYNIFKDYSYGISRKIYEESD